MQDPLQGPPGDPAAALTLQFSAIGVRTASSQRLGERFPCGISVLDDFLDGGLPRGAVVEWGSPLGSGGRQVLLPWLSRMTSGPQGPGAPEEVAHAPAYVLWAHGRSHLTVCPPAWQARGVSLGYMRFVCTGAPLADLRPVFLDPLFRMIVLDGPRQFSDDDLTFVARQARALGQIVIVIRDYFLGPRSTSVWARLRVNCWRDGAGARFRLRVIRGLSPRQIELNEDQLLPCPGNPYSWA